MLCVHIGMCVFVFVGSSENVIVLLYVTGSCVCVCVRMWCSKTASKSELCVRSTCPYMHIDACTNR